MTIIVKTSTKGQITLPAAWRKKYKTDSYIVKTQGESLSVTPFFIDELDHEQWETIFDAKRDNNDQSVSIDDFIAALKQSLA